MFNQLTTWENILLAYRKASKGKRGHPNVAAFEYHLEENLLQLQHELQTGAYQPGRYNNFYIHEPKKRLISAAPFRDRVVHHALCNIIMPVFERSFIHDSYANRAGKGTHRALNRCQYFARTYTYVLQCDFKQFFPSIDHQVLYHILIRKIHDQRMRVLIQKILSSGYNILNDEYDMVYFPGDDLFAINRPRGLPIGNLTSQFWANVYLNEFDHFIKRELQCKAYLRYVDDFLLFHDNKNILWEWKKAILKRILDYRLTIHNGAHPQLVTEGISFLGFRVFPQKRRLKRRKGIHFQRKLKKMVDAYQYEKLSFKMFKSSLLGWINHLRWGNTIGLRKRILARVVLVRKEFNK